MSCKPGLVLCVVAGIDLDGNLQLLLLATELQLQCSLQVGFHSLTLVSESSAQVISLRGESQNLEVSSETRRVELQPAEVFRFHPVFTGSF